VRFLVLAPATADNSLGRALCVAATCRHLGPVEVAARDTGPLWVGASSWDLEVRRWRGPRSLAALAQGEDVVLVAIKPLPTSLGAAAYLRRRGLGSALVADLDEDDLELRRSSVRRATRYQSVRRHLRLAAGLLPGHPWVVGGLLRTALPRAGLVTVSSTALGRAVVPPGQPVFTLPHARERQPYAAPPPAERLRIGFLGTPRGYKGTAVLRELLAAAPDAELHLLGERPPDELAGLGDRVVAHPQRGPETLAAAYAAVDIVVLPQDPGSRQTALQLPAKLVDALVHGRPVIATGTPPIREIGGDAILCVDRWNELDEPLAALERLRDPAERERLGRRAHERSAAYTTAALAEGLGQALRGAGVA
jgi:glycosyltransferase involved in cell wall biosynthesis